VELAKELIASFLKAKFQDIDKYQRRLDKVKAIEVYYSQRTIKNSG
jgi:ribose 5-phosphate isomerase RpiB